MKYDFLLNLNKKFKFFIEPCQMEDNWRLTDQSDTTVGKKRFSEEKKIDRLKKEWHWKVLFSDDGRNCRLTEQNISVLKI
jgi:hypothetical protein